MKSDYKILTYGSSVLIGCYLIYHLYRKFSSSKHDKNAENVNYNKVSIIKKEKLSLNAINAEILSYEEIILLTSMACNKSQMQLKALITIANKSVFTPNINLFRTTGSLEKLIQLLDALVEEDDFDYLNQCLIILNNLSLNENNQIIIKACIDNLFEIVSGEKLKGFKINKLEIIQGQAYNCLVNLSTTNKCLDRFLPHINWLIENFISNLKSQHTLVDNTNSLRLLLNLSCDSNFKEILITNQNLIKELKTVNERKISSMNFDRLNFLMKNLEIDKQQL